MMPVSIFFSRAFRFYFSGALILTFSVYILYRFVFSLFFGMCRILFFILLLLLLLFVCKDIVYCFVERFILFFMLIVDNLLFNVCFFILLPPSAPSSFLIFFLRIILVLVDFFSCIVFFYLPNIHNSIQIIEEKIEKKREKIDFHYQYCICLSTFLCDLFGWMC